MKFSKYNKNLADAYSLDELKSAYKNSENLLESAIKSGNQKELDEAMKIHGDIEYAMLYKQKGGNKFKMKHNKGLIVCISALLILGAGAAVIGIGSNGFKNWDTSTWFSDAFKGVSIESKVFEYDGENKTLDIIVPENATYELTITNSENEVVESCVDIGKYNYKVVVKIGDLTKEFNATLEIVDKIDDVEISSKSESIKLGVTRTYKAASGDVVKEITYNVLPEGCDQSLSLVSILKEGTDASSYVSCDIDSGAKKITLTCHEAFDKQIIVTVKSSVVSTITATITCDYNQRVLSNNSSFINSSMLDSVTYSSSDGNFYLNLNDHIVYMRVLSEAENDPISNYFRNSVEYSVGTIPFSKSTVSYSFKKDSLLTSDHFGNQYFDGQEFDNFFKFSSSSNSFIFGAYESAMFNSITDITYKQSNHEILLGEISCNDEAGQTHRANFYMKADSPIMDSISLSGSSVVF